MTDRPTPPPTHDFDEHGHRYTHPHVSIDHDPPWSTDRWTRWEVQEMRRHWRNAVLAAERTHRLAHNALAALHEVGGPDTVRATDIHSLIREPTQLAEALAAIQAVRNGIVHRLAVADD